MLRSQVDHSTSLVLWLCVKAQHFHSRKLPDCPAQSTPPTLKQVLSWHLSPQVSLLILEVYTYWIIWYTLFCLAYSSQHTIFEMYLYILCACVSNACLFIAEQCLTVWTKRRFTHSIDQQSSCDYYKHLIEGFLWTYNVYFGPTPKSAITGSWQRSLFNTLQSNLP